MKMKKFGFLAIFVVILAALSAGCASYGAKTGFPEFQPADGRLTKIRAGDYVVSAFPLNKEEGKEYFDYDLEKDRVAAVFMEVDGQPNGGDVLSSVSLDFDNVVLYPMNREEVYYTIRNEYWAKASLWYFVGYIGAPISALHTKSVNKKIEEDLNRKLLVSGSGLKDLKGFLIFKIPEGLAPKGSAAISAVLKLVLKIGGKEAIYSLPLSPVKFPDPEPPAAPKLNE